MSQLNQPQWLILVHRLPPKPDYLRVKVRRRLDRLGAIALKNSVYVLPAREETEEDFQWVAVEIEREGGEALIFRSTFVSGVTEEEVIARFNAEREEAYNSISASVAAELRQSDAGRDSSNADERDALQNSYARVQRRLNEIVRLDFFGATGRANAENELRRFHEIIQRNSARVGAAASAPHKTESRSPGSNAAAHPHGATWVTRAGIFVDRMASAWLIRRFIDPAATFKFVKGTKYRAAAGEIRFDMARGEYTHEGEMCTFEVLVDRFELHDPGLDAIAELVHDVDLKDEKFGRLEAPGIEAVLKGIVNVVSDDDSRIAAAVPVFDALYDRFRESAA